MRIRRKDMTREQLDVLRKHRLIEDVVRRQNIVESGRVYHPAQLKYMEESALKAIKHDLDQRIEREHDLKRRQYEAHRHSRRVKI